MIIVRFFTPDKLVPFYDDYLRLIKTYFVFIGQLATVLCNITWIFLIINKQELKRSQFLYYGKFIFF